MKSKSYALIGAICIATVLAIVVVATRPAIATAPPAQDVMALDNRLRMLEQRIYGIEASITRLEQRLITSQSSSSSVPAQRDPEINSIRIELEQMKLRVREL